MAFTRTRGIRTDLPPETPKRMIDTSNIPLNDIEGIQENIENTAYANVPARQSVLEGVGALLASTPLTSNEDIQSAIDIPSDNTVVSPLPTSVPAETQMLTEGQSRINEDRYAERSEQRFKEAQGGFNLTDQQGNFDSSVTLDSLTDLSSTVVNKVNNIESIWDEGEAATINNFAESQTERLADPESSWSKYYGEARPIDKTSKEDQLLVSGLTVAGASWFDDITMKRYLKQAMDDGNFNEETRNMTPYEVQEYRDNREIKEPLSEKEIVKSFEEGEPILNAMISSGVNNFMKVNPTDLAPLEAQRNTDYRTARQEGIPAQEAETIANNNYRANVSRQKQEDLETAREMSIVYLKDLTDQGYIAWARNLRGKVIPIETPKLLGSNMISPSSKINILYNIGARDSRTAGVMASPNPSIVQSKLDDNTKQVFLNKMGKVIPSNAAQTAMDLQGSVGIGVNPISLAAMNQIYKSKDPLFANTLSELGDSAFAKYLSKHDNAVAQKIMEDKQALLDKEVEDVNKRANSGLTLFTRIKQSLSTLRYFPITNNLNITGQKGTTRTTMSFRGVAPVKITNEIFKDNKKVLGKAKEIYLSDNTFDTLYRGQSVNDKLHNLKNTNNDVFQAMNFYYNLGFQYMKHIDPSGADNFLPNKPTYTWSTPEIIEYGMSMQDNASKLGKQYIDSITNNTLVDFANENKWMTDKGEWQYPSTVITDAYQIQQALDNGGNPYLRLENLMEQDARQSNAGIISLLVGDDTTAGLLGMVNGSKAASFSGLREKIFSSYKDDITSTFGIGEAGLAKAWTNLFTQLAKGGESKAAKIYSRGLVVAGLYGKTTQKMYSEATDMLAQINAATYNNPELFEAFNELTSNYSDGVNSMEILDDITDILTTASHSHMSKLNGYQTAMKSIGGAMAAINAPTSIRNMLGGIQQISGNNLSPILRDNIEMQVFGDNISRKNVAGMNIIQYEPAQDRARSAATRIDDRGEVTEQRAGTAQRNAWPVDIIQGGDSTIMTLALLAMNSPSSGFKGNPVQVQVIHDAVLSGPEGHLIATNAYNNIAIPVYAKNVQPLMSSVIVSYKEHLNYIKSKYGTDGANIGTQFIAGEDNVNTSFHGLTGYFDRLYDIAYRGAEDTMDNPDMSVENNLRGNFITSRQYDRSPDKQKSNAKSNLKYKVMLEIARDNGYKPPTEGNDEARRVNRVTGKEFTNLIDIMRAGSGLLNTNEKAIPALFDAWAKLPAGFKVSVASTQYHMVPYSKGRGGKENGSETSGVLSKITGNNPNFVNTVLKNMKGNTGFITHLR
jgi:hypothetical protein